jgi:hypothetical protein
MPSQLPYTKAVEEFLPGNAMEGPLRRSWTLGFLSSLGKTLLRERKRSFDNWQREETSAGWMNMHAARSWSAHTVQTISTNSYSTNLKDLLSAAVLIAAHSL